MCLKTIGCVANSEDPDQMSNSAESDFPRLMSEYLGLNTITNI